ncbi:hypothetical protein GE09DRAFT_52382 [Coniochaeta sp. 2T2.1]|nr:hypothetical protein GE09DRAFT_52382 [Coniochaeta sp. 2T2.1]
MGSQLNMSYSREQTLVRTQPTAKPGLKSKPRQQNQQGHFDPEELTRRLYIVLADRKAHEERKRTRQHEDAKLKDARSWTSRHHSNREAAGRRSKEATREMATSQPSSGRQISLRAIGSSSSEKAAKQRKDAPPPPPPEPTGGSSYHHIPQEAAKQFQRTTTVAPMRESSSSTSNILQTKLSKQALKLHLASSPHQPPLQPNPDAAAPISPVLNHYLHTHTRVDEWRSRIPEDVLDEEETEEYHLAPQHQQQSQDPYSVLQDGQHTFAAELAKLKPPPTAQNNNRRNSTGDILASPPTAETTNRLSLILPGRTSLADVLESPAPPLAPPVCADEHRVDWTQSDEAQARRAAAAAAEVAAAAVPQPVPQQRQHKPLLLTPLLRKADSIWTLRGRLGSGSGGGGTKAAAREQMAEMERILEKEGEKAEKGSQTSSKSNNKSPRGEPRSPGREGREPRSPIGGFFAKFKR